MPDFNPIKDTEQTEFFWTQRYDTEQIGWDIGYPSPPIKSYFNQRDDKDLRILIPVAGYGYEAEYLFYHGFRNVFVLDIAKPPLDYFYYRLPDFPKEQLIHANFFEHEGEYDIIVEQTFFCTLPPTPENRKLYAKKMASLLAPKGKLIGLWFKFPLDPHQPLPPYGGSKEEYLTYFSPYFDIKVLSECGNSIKPRLGNELFGVLVKK